MYQHTHLSAALAQERQADLLAAAQHARKVRLVETGRGRALRLRLRRSARLAGVPVPPTPTTATA